MPEKRPAWTYESIGARFWWFRYRVHGIYWRWKVERKPRNGSVSV